MIFNLFGSKKQPDSNAEFVDYVFVGNQGKINALLALAKENKNTIFIAWFSNSVTALKNIFIKNGLDENNIIDAKYLHAGMLHQSQPILVEHYPILKKETDFVEKFNINKIPVYSSLEEPLFKHFGGDKIISMAKLLGLKENEPIVHSMVSKSIGKAQQKIADKVLVEQSADSQEEWLKKNL